MNEQRKLNKLEISKMLSVPLEFVEDYYKYMQDVLTLEQPVSEDSDLALIDLIPQKELLENQVFKDFLRKDIEVLFKVLNDQEVEVIKMKYGLCEYADGPFNIYDIAKKLSASQQKIKKIESKALMKMRGISKYDKKINSLKEYM